MNARTETLAEVIEWLKAQADSEWECAQGGLSDGYGGFDAYTRAIQHCQDMIVEDEASSGKHTEIALLKHLADTFDERLRKAEQARTGEPATRTTTAGPTPSGGRRPTAVS